MKVVIIDDEPLISDKLKRIMETGLRGMHTVCAFTDAQTALDYIEQEKPGVILTDIRMPGITGIDLAKQINQMDYGAKIVFLTGYAEFEYAREALRLQAVDYLLKPVEEEELVRVMKNIAKDLANQAELEAGGENGPVSNREVNELTDWLYLLQEPGLNPHVRRVLERIVTAYNQHLSIEELAGELQVSTSYLSRQLKEGTGHTFGGLLARYRLQKALKLLAEGEYRVYEVAEQTGFGEYKNFCQTFKKYLHESPKRYMQQRENQVLQHI